MAIASNEYYEDKYACACSNPRADTIGNKQAGEHKGHFNEVEDFSKERSTFSK